MRRLGQLLAVVLPLTLPAGVAVATDQPDPPALRVVAPAEILPTGATARIQIHTEGMPAGAVLRWHRLGAHPGRGAEAIPPASATIELSWRGDTAGRDELGIAADLDGDGLEEAGEPYATALVRWHPGESYVADGVESAPSLAGLSAPRRYREVNVEAVRGTVRVQLPSRPGAAPGGRFRPLVAAARLPAGTLVDATRGAVAIEAAVPSGNLRASFGRLEGGAFTLRQSRTHVEVALAGGDFARRCRRGGGRVVRRLSGTGAVRVRARHSHTTSARGTWRVLDRCDGTLTRLGRAPGAAAEVRDLVRRRTIRLRAGRGYLARPRAADRRG